jgi:hypothetical protein
MPLETNNEKQPVLRVALFERFQRDQRPFQRAKANIKA